MARQGLVVACASLLLFGVGFVFAAPTAPPPGTSVPLPLTRGAAAETKAGALTIQGQLTASGGICLGGVCRTTWPSSSLQSGYTTVSGTGNYSVSSYNYYGTHTYYYYQYNQQYTQNSNYYWYDYNFSVSAPMSVTGVPLNVSNVTARCYNAVNSSYTYTPAPTSSYYTQSSLWVQPTNLSASISGTSVIVTGTCRLYLANGYYQTNYFAIPVSATVQYLY